MYFQFKILLKFTRTNVTKTYGGHCDEAKVKCIKEREIFKDTEEVGTNTEEETEEQKTTKSCF